MRIRLPHQAILLLFTIWSLLSSCVTPDNAKTETSKPRQSFLWEASKGDKVLTLVGTMHIGIKPEDMDPKLWTRLEAADTVIIETDLETMDAQLMDKYMALPPGQDMSRLLGAKHWAKFVKVLQASGSALGEWQLRRMTPLAAGALLLQVQAKADQEITAGAASIDSIIYQRGRSLQKRLATLETNEEQLESLKAVFDIPAIQNVLDKWESESENYGALKQAFKDGDTVALDDLLKEIPENMRFLLLETRNKKWMEKLPLLQGTHTVLAVGAAHFAGETGLLNLLQGEGYEVRLLK